MCIRDRCNPDLGVRLYELVPGVVVCQERDGQVVIAVSNATRPIARSGPNEVGRLQVSSDPRYCAGTSMLGMLSLATSLGSWKRICEIPNAGAVAQAVQVSVVRRLWAPCGRSASASMAAGSFCPSDNTRRSALRSSQRAGLKPNRSFSTVQADCLFPAYLQKWLALAS